MCYNIAAMKPALIAAIMLTVAIHLAPRSKAKQDTNSVEQQASQQPTSPNNNKRPTTETDATKNKPPSWYESPEWVLVIVGGITCFVIGYQSYATMIAAKAAKLNADAGPPEYNKTT